MPKSTQAKTAPSDDEEKVDIISVLEEHRNALEELDLRSTAQQQELQDELATMRAEFREIRTDLRDLLDQASAQRATPQDARLHTGDREAESEVKASPEPRFRTPMRRPQSEANAQHGNRQWVGRHQVKSMMAELGAVVQDLCDSSHDPERMLYFAPRITDEALDATKQLDIARKARPSKMSQGALVLSVATICQELDELGITHDAARMAYIRRALADSHLAAASRLPTMTMPSASALLRAIFLAFGRPEGFHSLFTTQAPTTPLLVHYGTLQILSDLFQPSYNEALQAFTRSLQQRERDAWDLVLTRDDIGQLSTKDGLTQRLPRLLERLAARQRPTPTASMAMVDDASADDDNIDEMEAVLAAADLSRVRCYNCRQLGHISRNCTRPRRLRSSNTAPTPVTGHPEGSSKPESNMATGVEALAGILDRLATAVDRLAATPQPRANMAVADTIEGKDDGQDFP